MFWDSDGSWWMLGMRLVQMLSDISMTMWPSSRSPHTWHSWHSWHSWCYCGRAPHYCEHIKWRPELYPGLQSKYLLARAPAHICKICCGSGICLIAILGSALGTGAGSGYHRATLIRQLCVIRTLFCHIDAGSAEHQLYKKSKSLFSIPFPI